MTTVDPTTTAPQPAPLDLTEIEARAHYYGLLSHQIGNSFAPDLVKAGHACADDVPALVAEVRRLRAELDNARGWCDLKEGELASANAQRDHARAERDMLAKAVVHPDRLVDATKLDAAPAAPRTYQLPAEPPPEVDKVWDRSGQQWCRLNPDLPGDVNWVPADTFADEVHISEAAIDWRELIVDHGPLSTAPPAGTEAQ